MFINKECVFVNECVCLTKNAFFNEECMFVNKECVFVNKKCVLLINYVFVNEECMFIIEECVFVNECVCVYVCVSTACVCFNKKRVFVIHFNCMFIKLVSSHLGQRLMLCNISVINLSD